MKLERRTILFSVGEGSEISRDPIREAEPALGGADASFPVNNGWMCFDISGIQGEFRTIAALQKRIRTRVLAPLSCELGHLPDPTFTCVPYMYGGVVRTSGGPP